MIDAITAQVSVANIVSVLAAAAAIAITFVFMWWGVRKVTRMVMGSARSGSIRPCRTLRGGLRLPPLFFERGFIYAH